MTKKKIARPKRQMDVGDISEELMTPYQASSEKKPEQLSLIECILKKQLGIAKAEEFNKGSKKKAKRSKKGPTTVKGLRNLGNTCFFNAVMQSLSQTPLLLGEVEASCVVGAQWTVPKLTLEDDSVKEDTKADPLCLELPRKRKLLNSFLNFLRQMTSPPQSKGEVVDPTDLFNKIQQKSPEFQPDHQHDSHELLRQFLDHLRQEEVKRQKIAIRKHFMVENPNQEINDHVRKLIKGYDSYASHTLVEKVFGGLLISTVLCEECKTSSQIFEPFWDLSLPLFEEKQQDLPCPLLNGGRDTKVLLLIPFLVIFSILVLLLSQIQLFCKFLLDSVIVGRPTNHYCTRLQREEIEICKHPHNFERKEEILQAFKKLSRVDLDENEFILSKPKQDYSKPRSLEKKQKMMMKKQKKAQRKKSFPDLNKKGAEVAMGDCLDVNQEAEDCPSENEDIEEILLQKVLESIQQNSGNKDIDEITLQKVLEEIFQQNLVNEFLDESNQLHYSVEDVSSTLERLEITAEDISPVMTDLAAESPPEGTDVLLEEALPKPTISLESNVDEKQDCNGEKGGDELSEHMQVQGVHIQRDSERVTLSDGGSTKEDELPAQECSVQSCLAHFTRLELLAEENQFRCDHCTELKRTCTGDETAVAYSNASKQLLVFRPPAILTLHLKRFQQALPHMSSVLYSLYAVVEHRGRLTRGHYTAYVRLPPQPNRRTSFLNALPQDLHGDLTQLLQRLPTTPREETEEGRWFYVSDTMVREVSEAQVLECQAYLLFYERIK